LTILPATTGSVMPLGNLPSVLAIRDLKRRLGRVLRDADVGQEELIRILQLDPLAVVRGLRAANAPIFSTVESGWSVRRLGEVLGPALTRQLLDTPALSVAGTTSIRRLWLHAIATATAAQELALQTGQMDPEEAYLLGLLHDLPLWLEQVEQRSGITSGIPAREWITHWQLPRYLLDVIDAADRRGPRGARAPKSAKPQMDATTLVLAAELLAELADFGHPNESLGGDAAGAVLAAAEKSDLVAAQKLRRQVEASLRSFGLDPTMPDVDLDGDLVSPISLGQRRGSLDEVVLSLLGCTRSETYRGIVTAMTAAAVRYGGYDRAFYVRWDRASGKVLVRSKADSSARRLWQTTLVPTSDEATALQSALLDERPVRLRARIGERVGLLASMSADEALAVPLNRAFATPAFLVLDRSLSSQPIQLDADSAMAMTLGMTGSLLIENLLLRRRRQRAQKFALTDSLTRLYNRRMGLVTLDQEVARADRAGRPLTVLMCDLDHFKQLNDAHGHLQGDVALRAVADVLRQMLRKSDTICRYGGEEFLVVLPDTRPDEATVLATRLFTAVQTCGENLGLPVTISIGLTIFRPGDNVETILQRADHALYASKDYGRNRFSVDAEGTEDPQVARQQ
jgi:diguanylate cyclase (GGDEF)-like protein